MFMKDPLPTTLAWVETGFTKPNKRSKQNDDSKTN